MAQFLYVLPNFRSERADRLRLLGVLLIGSLTGALWARLQVCAPSGPAFGPVQTAWLPVWLRAALFPCLLAVSYLLGSRALFFMLFFLKGVLVSFTLCFFARLGADQLLSVLPALCVSTLLPLPVLLWGASVWLGARGCGARPLILLVPMLLLALLGALIRTALGL